MTDATGWNIADIWEAVASRFGDETAQLHGDRRYTWRQFDDRADALAAHLLAAGVAEQDKVAQYLYNGPEYLESTFAAFKAGLATVNTNYRYTAHELTYLWDNADVVAVVFHDSFAETADSVRSQLPRIRTWLWVDDSEGKATCPDWATPYESVAQALSAQSGAGGPVAGAWGRSGDHLLLLYTGGTTGMPKGVMWRQHDLIGALERTNGRDLPPVGPAHTWVDRLTKVGPRNLPAAPLMHGTGLFNALTVLLAAGSVVTLTGRKFDPAEVLDTVERERVKSITIVGDAFGKPILRALDAEPDRWDLSGLRVVLSSGVMWSQEVKDGLLRHAPHVALVDALGSSEAIGMASSARMGNTGTGADPGAGTASFKLGAGARVITEDGRDVVWGTGERGLVAMRGYVPMGYYKDEAKSATTFRVIDGDRYTIPGDWATVDADGTVRLLGRGSQCINTGGEKVYPEEVEETLKRHPDVHDAAVVGLPDDRFGEIVAALVEPNPGHRLDPAALVEHVRDSLAGYKVPRHLVVVESVERAPNGKLDYKRLRDIAYRTER